MSNLEIAAIRRDGGAQMREAIEQDTVTQYAEHIIDGVEFPPLVVFYDGSDYWLADGFHRIAAYEEAGADTVPVDVRSGQLLDAIKFALKANATNGKPRTSGDLARSYQAAVDKGLCDPTSTKDVKDLLGCSKRWARRLTKEARTEQNTKRNQRIQELSEEGLSQREIAEEVGTSQKSVDRVLSESERHSSVLTHPEGGGDEEAREQDKPSNLFRIQPQPTNESQKAEFDSQLPKHSRIQKLNNRLEQDLEELEFLVNGNIEPEEGDEIWINAIKKKGPGFIQQFHNMGIDLNQVYNILINPNRELENHEGEREERTQHNLDQEAIDIKPRQVSWGSRNGHD